MKPLLTMAVAGAISAVAALPVQAQSGTSQSTMQGQSTTEQNAPGSGGVSKPGVSGQPGNKSGPAVRPGNGTSESGTSGSSTVQQQDESKVPGLPGNKSGPSVRSPGSGSSGSNDSGSRTH